MQSFQGLGTALTVLALYGQRCWAQDSVPYTEPTTGITFPTWSDGKGYTFGMVVPDTALTTDEYDYIGYLSCTTPAGAGKAWCGLSHGQSGQMSRSLLVVAWPYQDQVLTSFRYASGYVLPEVYTGDAKLTTLASSVSDTAFMIVYKCERCWTWSQGGAVGNVSTSSGVAMLGRAAADDAVGNPGCPDDITIPPHARACEQFRAPFTDAKAASYDTYAMLPAKATKLAATCGGATPSGNAPTENAPTGHAPTKAGLKAGPKAGPTSTPTVSCQRIPGNKTYDYVIVGGGAGGLPMADKLSEAGHSVLLVEKGPPSTGRWGGSLGPDWLAGTGLTRFDVPGLLNQIWVNSTGVACTDTDQMAGCVLGGGTAVNAGLWWRPNPLDWDENFPAGWHSSDVADATDRVFQRIPGTSHPSMDGKLYLSQGYDTLAGGLGSAGWEYVVANESPDQKNRTYGHPNYMYSNGERGGPLATYLATAMSRKALFTMWTDTAANRIVRDGSHATGVEVSCLAGSGYAGTVRLTPGAGRVIVSAGAFGSPKLLFRSGIGPTDQLTIVQGSSDGATMVAQSDWINLPVGYNVVEQMNTDIIITHPDVVPYDFIAAWTNPIKEDMDAYLGSRTGILSQAAPNIGPMMWENIKVSDGTTRQLQWTSRVEADVSVTKSPHAMTMSQYLGRGQVSRGRVTISPELSMSVSTQPFFHNDGDREAVIQGIKNMQAALAGVKGLEWIRPRANQTVENYVDSLLVTANGRRVNHWMGTNKMGTDDGRVGGTAVVDTNTMVYGTDNIFVVDASIFPAQITTNPSGMIVTVAEHAAEKILALTAPVSSSATASKGKVSSPPSSKGEVLSPPSSQGEVSSPPSSKGEVSSPPSSSSSTSSTSRIKAPKAACAHRAAASAPGKTPVFAAPVSPSSSGIKPRKAACAHRAAASAPGKLPAFAAPVSPSSAGIKPRKAACARRAAATAAGGTSTPSRAGGG